MNQATERSAAIWFWEGEAPAEPWRAAGMGNLALGGRGSCRAVESRRHGQSGFGRTRLLPSRGEPQARAIWFWEGEAPAESWRAVGTGNLVLGGRGSCRAVESRRHGQSGWVARGTNRDCFTYVRNDDRGWTLVRKWGLTQAQGGRSADVSVQGFFQQH